jgi:hypothetical protein
MNCMMDKKTEISLETARAVPLGKNDQRQCVKAKKKRCMS